MHLARRGFFLPPSENPSGLLQSVVGERQGDGGGGDFGAVPVLSRPFRLSRSHRGNRNLRPRPPDAYANLLRALSAIGNNINQLAHQANTRGAATGDEITEALRLVRRATRLVRERL